MALTLVSAVVSDTGPYRTNNEDVAIAGRRLAVVADGMGGMPDGEVASDLAVRALEPMERLGDNDPVAALHAAFNRANDAIGAAAAGSTERQGMGTTMTALLAAGSRMVVGHVGDSRCYLLREGRLHQLTRDDTYVQALVDQGVIRPEQARTHPHRALVTCALQGTPVDPTITVLSHLQGDRFMLCSDGLTDEVDDETIAHLMSTVEEPYECAAALVRAAIAAGSRDNVTVLVADARPVD
ncbi:protein phosphatase 2C domain-containing protein [Micromonospora sp. NPDC005298]|uniref:PP2C family protein-serine/threonine phosphatase n=1 Tax=Micromonospora sp. NPDC005298 TaxID=3156873 RepID=UPI0033B3740F